MNPVPVDIGWANFSLFAQAGAIRQVNARRYGARRETNQDRDRPDRWKDDILGCCSEFALSLFLHESLRPLFDGPVDYRIPDLSGGNMVRSTDNPHGGLIVHDDADDNLRWWLVTSDLAPIFVIHGWLWGWEAKQAKYKRGPNDKPALPRPAYWIPQSDLHEPATRKAPDDRR